MFRSNTSIFHNCTINASYTFCQAYNKAYHMPTTEKHSISPIFVLLFLLFAFLFENIFLTSMMKNLIPPLLNSHQTPLHFYKKPTFAKDIWEF